VTPHDDYVDEMGTPLLDDEAIEAFFLGTGQSSGGQNQALLTLAEDVLVAAGGPPPRPHGALLVFLEDATPAASAAPALVAVPTLAPGATTPWQPEAATRSASAYRCPNLRLLGSRRLRLTAGIAAGVGIAAASLTVAGTTGSLPDPAMRAIVRVVEAVTPFELAEPSTPPPSTVPAPQPGTISTVPATPGAGSGAVGQSGPTEQPSVTTPPAVRPESVPPTGDGPVQPGSTGLDRAGQTPAGPFIPPFVTGAPVGPPPAPSGDSSSPPSTGVDRARETPAGTFIPPFAGGPPGRR
jgi:hypothetical protein